MNEVSKITGRSYKLFDYFGPENPEHVLVALGSSAETCAETCEYLNKN